MKTLEELPLRTKEKQEFSNRKIMRDNKTNFVHFVGLIKAVYKNDHEGKNSSRFWERLKPELEKKDCKKIDDEMFISPDALNKFVSQNAAACKKTWGAFYDDGLELMLNELDYNKLRLPLSSPGGATIAQKTATAGASSSKTLIEQALPSSSTKSLQEGLLNAREKNLNDQEALLAQRAAVLSERERICAEKEEHNEKKQQELKKQQKRLNKKEQEISAPEMMKFVEQVSSLANKFKAKASRSRRNSSEERIPERSPTPQDVSDDENKNDKNDKKDEEDNKSMSRSPSPIPGSPADDREVSGVYVTFYVTSMLRTRSCISSVNAILKTTSW